MAKVNLSTIKNWFKTGLIPTQTQFWDTWDSFFHKDEQIPASSIQDIDLLLNSKAEKADFQAHLVDENAHLDLFKKAKIYQANELQIFKANGNIGNELEQGDFVCGIIEGKYIQGTYNGNDKALLSSYPNANYQET